MKLSNKVKTKKILFNSKSLRLRPERQMLRRLRKEIINVSFRILALLSKSFKMKTEPNFLFSIDNFSITKIIIF
ncbi:hypothetical protein BpHYR1_048603 [Brachionus plicatilis]|uniref:Uncharacterized protein n=1 Tax=Brachionus plicatilis TaxID=10195 RepID=A0A3M7PBL8_BRAPC|nr:hypothetical protein BpHYR1_048603 [Brachionus plicatilis]